MYDSNIMKLAIEVSNLSTDPSTKVGCVIIDSVSKDILSVGYNSLKKWVIQTDFNYVYSNKSIKRYATEHAEIQAFKNLKPTNSELDVYITYPSCLPCTVDYLLNENHNIKNIFYIDRGSDSFIERYQVGIALELMDHKNVKYHPINWIIDHNKINEKSESVK